MIARRREERSDEALRIPRRLPIHSSLTPLLIAASRFGMDVGGADIGEVDLPKGDELEIMSKLEVNERMLKVLLNVVDKKGYRLEDSFIDDSKRPHASRVSDIESELILRGDAWLWRAVGEVEFNADEIPEAVDSFMAGEGEKKFQLLSTPGGPPGKKQDPPTASQIRAYENRRMRKLLENRKVVGEELLRVKELKQKDVNTIISSLKKSEEVVDPLQKTLDGKISNNLWIVKPAGKSRGR